MVVLPSGLDISPVDNTSRASVTTPEMAAAGYQQDPGMPDTRQWLCRVITPENMTFSNQKTARGGLSCRDDSGLACGSVADHHATTVRVADPMTSGTAAGASAGFHDNRAGNDDDFAAVRHASFIGTAMKARTAAFGDLDDHAGRSLLGRQRQGLHGCTRYSQDESKSDKLVHLFLPDRYCAD